ncbi:MAG: filamentous hemagglutinin N-terminal domain-containing protein, partial [Chlamydiia bacterium]|nr:filamentous hemagglutinin N-terminal domain-containing protein [Chlamydiia bacterium]
MKSTLGFCLAIFLMPALFAAPKGFKPHKGTASASQEGHRTLVRSGQKAIIHWDQFSIESGELVHFHQKDATSRVLNRVMGKDASRIYGRLTSNGQVFLINPQGIYIGPSGRIETNGFVGSTLNLLDQDFWEGKDLFFHEPGSGLIKNLGVISCPAGDIVLIARAIENEGTINSPSGLTACGSGVEVLLKPDGDQRISIRPDLSLPNDENEIAIQNYGDIEALAVEMKTSKNPYEKAIHCSGAVTAFRQKEEGGRIYLVGNHGKTVVEGSLEARSGTVHILGKEVSVVDEAVIDVSGSTGGTLLVGGDYQGKNPNILNAQTTTVSKDASMYADGFEGDGGRIIVWSDGETFCGAEMSACARGNQGDGGFIEISGAKSVASPTHPDLRAKNGKDGTLLLDAGPITISSGGASGPTAYGSTFINAQLGLGNFSLDTGSEPGPGEQSLTVDGTVTGADEITWANANKLTLIGGRNVEIQSGAAIRATGSGDLEIQGNGTFVALTDFNGIFVNGGTLEVANGAMTLTGTGGQASFNRGILVNNSGVVQATGSGSISMTGTATLTGGVQNKEGVSIGTMGPSIGTVQVNNGNLTILGRGGDGFLSQGVEINFGGVIRSTGSGNISITGFGGNTTGNFSNGFVIGTATIEATGTGSITINGTGEGTGFRSIGVERFPEAFAPGTGIIQTESGNITINATGAVNGGVDCPGLSLQGPTSGSGIVRTNAGGNIII